MDVTLREITIDNYHLVCNLAIPKEQQNHLAHNAWSLVASHYHDTHHARAIYLDSELVGFIMWVYESKVKVSIWRFMVAYKHQKKGIGQEALQKAVNEIKADTKLEQVEICYSMENTIARKLYLSFGFRETGMDEDDEEMLAVIDL